MRYLLAAFIFPLSLALAAAAPRAEERTPATGAAAAAEPAKYEQLRKEHWAFQPASDVPAPQAHADAWVKSDIDPYILAGLEGHDLKPSPPADRRTLLRRATFDLTGLPPTPEEVEDFVNDSSSKAFEKVVDRLLASPAFGERWGRHWLDVARYAESTGMSRNVPMYYAWRYRDYVIDSFNADKPFDRFIREQVAGDLLPAESDAQRDAQLIATGFLAIGPKDINERNPLQFTLNTVDEQIDATTRAFLGLTVSCARCHDHKFDPVPTAEYYALAGIFRSTELLAGVSPRGKAREYYKPDLLVSLTSEKPAKKSKQREKTVDAKVDATSAVVIPIADTGRASRAGDRDKARRQKMQEERRRQMQRQQMRQPAEPEIRPVAMGVRDGRLPADSAVFFRGERDDRGPVVPRGTITLPDMQPLGSIPSNHSGRLELADWLASARNPLTARVMVNRIWQHLFGQGLVRTVDNFGTTGELPSHPELLDHLAQQFTSDDWSVKRMIRQIMLSAAYQQAGTFDEAKYAADPDNRFVWRMTPRRLEAEAIRDAMLSASGGLDRVRPVGSPVMKASPLELARPRGLDKFDAGSAVRSVYLPMLRGTVPGALDVFDLADNTQVTGSRDVTTVAPQALYMMNDAFVLAQSKAFAQRVTSERKADLARVDRAYGLALGRVPSPAERQRAIKYVRAFMKDASADAKKRKTAEIDAWISVCQALLGSAEFRYVN